MKFFKHPVVIVIEIVLMCFVWHLIGFSKGKNSHSDIIQKARVEWNEIYDRGIMAGERTGFNEGYAMCWNGLGMNWIGSRDRFQEFSKEYGNIHNTPWNSFSIEEKVTIAMYGGSGSKLEQEEIEEWASKYGIQKEAKDENNTEIEFLLPKKITTDIIGDFLKAENYGVK